MALAVRFVGEMYFCFINFTWFSQVPMGPPVSHGEDFRYHGAGGATMPRLSSASMRSTGSHSSSGNEQQALYARHQQQPKVVGGTLGRHPSAGGGQYGILGRPMQQATPPQSRPQSGSQYGPGMTRPTARPPSPPLPPPPQQEQQQPQHIYNPNYGRQTSQISTGGASDIYSRYI